MKKNIFFLLGLLTIGMTSYAQESETLDGVFYSGMQFIKPLKEGRIDGMEKAKPPKDTWTYSRLLEYKNDLANKPDEIGYGYFIHPSEVDENIYGFNYYCFNKVSRTYYFVTIISFDAEKKEKENAYLFTEKEALKQWWLSAFSFYESDVYKNIPDKYKSGEPPFPPYKK